MKLHKKKLFILLLTNIFIFNALHTMDNNNSIISTNYEDYEDEDSTDVESFDEAEIENVILPKFTMPDIFYLKSSGEVNIGIKKKYLIKSKTLKDIIKAIENQNDHVIIMREYTTIFLKELVKILKLKKEEIHSYEPLGLTAKDSLEFINNINDFKIEEEEIFYDKYNNYLLEKIPSTFEINDFKKFLIENPTTSLKLLDKCISNSEHPKLLLENLNFKLLLENLI